MRRLRSLTETECYARCHGWGEAARLGHVEPIRERPPAELSGEDLLRLCESWIERAETEGQAA